MLCPLLFVHALVSWFEMLSLYHIWLNYVWQCSIRSCSGTKRNITSSYLFSYIFVYILNIFVCMPLRFCIVVSTLIKILSYIVTELYMSYPLRIHIPWSLKTLVNERISLIACLKKVCLYAISKSDSNSLHIHVNLWSKFSGRCLANISPVSSPKRKESGVRSVRSGTYGTSNFATQAIYK